MEQTESLTIKIGLWIGIMLSAAAIVRVGLWQQATPEPGALNPVLLNSLETKGWSVQSGKPAARQDEELSWAQGAELINAKRYPGAVLSLVPVRARGPSTYTIETLIRPVLRSDGSQTKLLRFGKHERARLQPITKQRIDTACISGGLALANPNRMLRTKLEEETINTLKQQLERISGLRQTRNWDCLLVVVQQPANAQLNNELWSEVVGALSAKTGKRT